MPLILRAYGRDIMAEIKKGWEDFERSESCRR